MSKYKPLTDRLSGHGADEWHASFAELEEVLGFPLPKGARAGLAWWANDPAKAHSRAWVGSGWEVAEVDRPGGAVTFRRNAASADIEAASGIEEVQPEAARQASDGASRKTRLRRAAPAMAAGVAVMAGIATLVARGVIRRRAS